MSPRGRRPGGVDTRAVILDAAASEFADLGYDTTSMRGIARRAEVDPALVHHYFGGSREVFFAVIAQGGAALSDVRTAGPETPFEERTAFATFFATPTSDVFKKTL